MALNPLRCRTCRFAQRYHSQCAAGDLARAAHHEIAMQNNRFYLTWPFTSTVSERARQLQQQRKRRGGRAARVAACSLLARSRAPPRCAAQDPNPHYNTDVNGKPSIEKEITMSRDWWNKECGYPMKGECRGVAQATPAPPGTLSQPAPFHTPFHTPTYLCPQTWAASRAFSTTPTATRATRWARTATCTTPR